MARLLKVAAGLLVGLALLVLGGAWLVALSAQKKLVAVQDRMGADWKRFEPRVLADEARWKDDPLFAAHSGGDAAAVMFAHVRWEKDGQSPLPIAAALKEAGADWAKRADEFEVSGIDTRWMSQLGTFGFWDLEGEGTPVHQLPFALLSEPIPMFLDLQVLAKVRLLQGLKSGSPVEAAREVRELARLCLTTELLIGEMIGNALLTIERRAHEEALRRGQDVTSWTPISEVDQHSLRNLLWAAQGRSALLAPEPLSSHRFPVGECSGLREAVGQAIFLRGFLRDDQPERYEALGKALEASSCRLRRPRLAWNSTAPTPGELPVKGSTLCMQDPSVEPAACAVPDWVVHLPFARAFIGRTIITLATPDWFGKYREEEKVTP